MAGSGGTVIELLQHFKASHDDDGRVTKLLAELEELSSRVQAADLAADARLASKGRQAAARPLVPTTLGSDAGWYGSGGSDRDGGQRQSTGSEGVRTSASNVGLHFAPSSPGRSGGHANVKVEEAVLPMPPADTSVPLPTPPGGHEWEALQQAVNASVHHFSSASAKMGWKKWALTKAHSALVVSLFWWAVATAFRPQHPLSRPVQDYAFGHLCRHYVAVLLRLRGRTRDHYTQVWIEMMAAAVVNLLTEVFPRSAHKFGDDMLGLLAKQLRLWTAGALPADMHPSAYADAHDAAPAAYAVAAPDAGGGGAAGHRRHSQQQASAPPSQRPSSAGYAAHSAGGRRPLSSSSAPSSAPDAASGAASPNRPQGFVISKTSPVVAHMLGMGTTPGAPAFAGDVAGGGGGPYSTASFPGALPAAGASPHIIKGLQKHTVGGALSRLHRALDGGSDDDVGYARMASSPSVNASDALAAYEAAKRDAAASSAAARAQLVRARGQIDAMQAAAVGGGARAVKEMSDRLSGYIQNDIDRALAGQPTSTDVQRGRGEETKKNYLRPTRDAGAAGGGGGAGGGGVSASHAMAPLHEVRRVEGQIRAALSGARHSSTDMAAHVAASTRRREEAAAADWRPLAEYRVGTKDTRRRKLAQAILWGMDLEGYK